MLPFLPWLSLAAVVSGAMQDVQPSHCNSPFPHKEQINISGVDAQKNVIPLQGSVGLAQYLGIFDKPEVTDGCGQTLLFTATTPEEVARFVAKGFDPNHRSNRGTPLEVARNVRRHDIVAALFEHGATWDKSSRSDEDGTIVVDITTSSNLISKNWK